MSMDESKVYQMMQETFMECTCAWNLVAFIHLFEINGSDGVLTCGDKVFHFGRIITDTDLDNLESEHALLCDESWNCVPISEGTVRSVRPLNSEFDVYNFEVEFMVPVFEGEESCITRLSVFSDSRTCRHVPEDERREYPVGLNALFRRCRNMDDVIDFVRMFKSVRSLLEDGLPMEALVGLDKEILDDSGEFPSKGTFAAEEVYYSDDGLILECGEETLHISSDVVSAISPRAWLDNCGYLFRFESAKKKGGYIEVLFMLDIPGGMED